MAWATPNDLPKRPHWARDKNKCGKPSLQCRRNTLVNAEAKKTQQWNRNGVRETGPSSSTFCGSNGSGKASGNRALLVILLQCLVPTTAFRRDHAALHLGQRPVGTKEAAGRPENRTLRAGHPVSVRATTLPCRNGLAAQAEGGAQQHIREAASDR